MAHVVREITACQSALYAYVCTLLGTSSGAADVLQEANIVLWEKASEYDPSRPFLPWAFGIAYFQVLAHRKRLSRDKLVFDDELLNAVSDVLRRRDETADRELEALDGCVSKLAPHQRQVLDARYRDGQAVESIARRAGKAANATAAELYRVRKLLMDCIRRTMSAGGAA
ncbi:sigma-70 family RNA polymerase sigma factor [Humisphaera borealis]|uniref:Sigma-70 family RNA polymerase sigma factor n=1 Tax=Humisphaera borealis TaxID=2807512 RepID=A0A7M2X269_9BACT|nr:sigma-70 family RNA polymerase sigma factor [Humisphaera borealis]QOV90850.1 sigma-70 family RNA polymerase sigma factor [Humisphaera borealis]